jgi:hypothetical protein
MPEVLSVKVWACAAEEKTCIWYIINARAHKVLKVTDSGSDRFEEVELQGWALLGIFARTQQDAAT